MTNLRSVRLALVGMHALKDTISYSDIITCPIPLSTFLLLAFLYIEVKAFLYSKIPFKILKCHWMD